MRWAGLLLGCLVAVPQLAAAEDYGAIHTRASEAFAAGEVAAFREAVLDALALRPDYPPMLFNLAVAEARLGRDQEAIGLLSRLDAMGLVMPADAAAFPGLAGEPRFEELAAALAANAAPRGEALEVARLPGETGFLPEGLAVDPRTGDLLVGSVRQARIVRIDADTGTASAFAGNDPDNLWGVFGMRTEQGRLWVATSAVPETLGLPSSQRGRGAVLVYDLDTGALVHRCVYESPAVLGDVLPSGAGAWVSDSTGGIYHLAPQACAWTVLVPAGTFVSPQGLAPAGPGRLFVADYRGGIFLVDTASGESRRLPLAPGAPAVTLYGIDGLDRSGEWLLAVQNGLRPHRVIALRLTPGGDAVAGSRVLASGLASFDEPTLGVAHEGRFLFVANSGWWRYADGDAEPGGAPVILSVAVPGAP